MRNLFLITNDNYGIKEFEACLSASNFPVFYYDEGIAVHFKKDNEISVYTVQIEKTLSIEMFYDPPEWDVIKKNIPSPHFYSLVFEKMKHVKNVLKCIADRVDVLVDNDCGLILPGNEFVKLCNEKPIDWDWVYDEIDK